MIVIPANPNSVHIGMIRTGCLKTEFNPAYPARLNGIISQNEFRESISNINSKISSNRSQIICLVISIICSVAGLVLIIASAAVSIRLGASFIIIMGVGIGLTACGSILLSIGCCVIRIRRTTKMRHAIAEESKKYWSRSPTRCSWRLNVTIIRTGGYGRYARSVLIYRIIIDIHHAAASAQSVRLQPKPATPRSTPSAPPQDDTLPPPYPGEPISFCSQCGAPRSNLTANFCSSCGHQYNK